MTQARAFPFTPKSTKSLIEGDFWAVPLDDGSFACGRVLELRQPSQNGSRVSFLGGLMDWHGNRPPSGDELAASRVLRHGQMHILAITTTGGQILGNRSLLSDGIEPILAVEAGILMRGLKRIGTADRSRHSNLPSLSTWGFGFIQVIANKQFLGGGLVPDSDKPIWV